MLAAQARLLMADDTTARILSKTHALKPLRSTGDIQLRDGCHSSVVLAFDETDNMIVLVKTDIIHAGEWIDEILAHRSDDLAPPQIMWDRLSSNTATACSYVDLACNQHARQNFKDLEDQFPKIIRPILKQYKQLFANDAQTLGMTPAERLAYHQQHSRLIFNGIVDQCKQAIHGKLVTPNSDLGKAFQYVLTHKEALACFCEYEGAPLSNNLSERVIANLVLLRRCSHFFRTRCSAAIADITWSVGLSAFYAGVNIFQFFRLALANQQELLAEPDKWLPWRFLERYPEYKIKYKSRAGRLRDNTEMHYIAGHQPV